MEHGAHTALKLLGCCYCCSGDTFSGMQNMEN